jgi:putative DNA primase/helicase
MIEPDITALEDQLAELKAKLSAPTGAGPAAGPKRHRTIPKDWDILLTKEGSTAACLQNAITILAKDSDWAGVLTFDVFRSKLIFSRPPPLFPDDAPKEPIQPGDVLEDEHYSMIAAWLSRAYRVNFPTNRVTEAVQVVARQNTCHPVRAYLEALPPWDGVRRLDRMLATYFHAGPVPIGEVAPEVWHAIAENQPPGDNALVRKFVYLAKVGRWFMTSAVARAYEPGCRVQVVLILEGFQGKGKSEAIQTLVPDVTWFSDTPLDLRNKDSYQALQGIWVYELQEFDGVLRRAGEEAAKAFFSAGIDTYRKAYGREVQAYRRQNVFIGSTNKGAYLPDETGNRRYWPAEVRGLDIPALRRDRDQLWAEALHLYHDKGPRYPLSAEEVELFTEEQDARFIVDPWHDDVAGHLLTTTKRDAKGEPYTSVPEILGAVLGKEKGTWQQHDQNRVAKILRALKWKPAKVTEATGEKRRLNAYIPAPEATVIPGAPASKPARQPGEDSEF